MATATLTPKFTDGNDIRNFIKANPNLNELELAEELGLTEKQVKIHISWIERQKKGDTSSKPKDIKNVLKTKEQKDEERRIYQRERNARLKKEKLSNKTIPIINEPVNEEETEQGTVTIRRSVEGGAYKDVTIHKDVYEALKHNQVCSDIITYLNKELGMGFDELVNFPLFKKIEDCAKVFQHHNLNKLEIKAKYDFDSARHN
jgi:hypothetical protein